MLSNIFFLSTPNFSPLVSTNRTVCGVNYFIKQEQIKIRTLGPFPAPLDTFRLVLARLKTRKLINREASRWKTAARVGQSPGMAEREDEAGVGAALLDAEQGPVALGPL